MHFSKISITILATTMAQAYGAPARFANGELIEVSKREVDLISGIHERGVDVIDGFHAAKRGVDTIDGFHAAKRGVDLQLTVGASYIAAISDAVNTASVLVASSIDTLNTLYNSLNPVNFVDTEVKAAADWAAITPYLNTAASATKANLNLAVTNSKQDGLGLTQAEVENLKNTTATITKIATDLKTVLDARRAQTFASTSQFTQAELTAGLALLATAEAAVKAALLPFQTALAPLVTPVQTLVASFNCPSCPAWVADNMSTAISELSASIARYQG